MSTVQNPYAALREKLRREAEPYGQFSVQEFIRDCRERQLIEHEMKPCNRARALALGIVSLNDIQMDATRRDKAAEAKETLARMACAND